MDDVLEILRPSDAPTTLNPFNSVSTAPAVPTITISKARCALLLELLQATNAKRAAWRLCADLDDELTAIQAEHYGP